MIFQSTLPVGGATVVFAEYYLIKEISIHAPRGGSDPENSENISSVTDFNPRSPWGERPHASGAGAAAPQFQSTLPVGGATCGMMSCIMIIKNFNPRSPWGERLLLRSIYGFSFSFQSTLPVGGAT